ncbi:MAG: outer membrane beta-barrel protein [Niabella sp.]
MTKHLSVILILSCFISFTSIAQTTGIKGRLIDSADNRSLENSVISILKTDTTLVTFSRANSSGQFTVSLPDSTQKYLLLATHPSFADFIDSIFIKQGEVLDLNIISMLSKAKLLEEVIVRGNRSMFMRGDTTVFTADSFKVAEGASVEELLKKLPGFQVDRSGNITAMGETVRKVLVDGEEFFGSDPGIATKNLQANIVKEVEVYDRKSDQANFTGIDDGTSDKTVNLKLKEDKKKGYFGKIDAGAGVMDSKEKSDPRYYGAAMINAFKAKRKLSAYGISSNTGFMNLDWQDNDRFGGGNNMEMAGDGIFISNNDWNSSTGLPTNYNAGFHYSNKFNEDKHSINAGYKYVQIDAPGRTQQFSKNFADSTSAWNMTSITNFRNNTQKHNINLIYELKPDSVNSIKITTRGDMNFGKTHSAYTAENTDDNTGEFINTNTRNSDGNSDSKAYNLNVLWMHKFKKPFRTISVNTSLNNSSSKNKSTLYSKTDFYENNIIDSSYVIDQYNLINGNNTNTTTRLAYTEPLAKDFYMELSYALAYNKRNTLRDIFGKSASGLYDDKIDSLSNNYEFNDVSNSPGMSFRYNRNKINATIGATVGFTNYTQINKTLDDKTDFNYTNYFPRASIYYKLTPSDGIRFNYNGNTSAPSLQQMQPIRDNTDPLNQVIGNPDLRPSFSHSFRLSYNSWKMLNQRSIWVSANGGFTQNMFTSASYITNAARTTQTVNANGAYNFSFYGSYYRLVSRKLNLRLGFSPEYNIYNRVDFVSYNGGSLIKNNTNNTTYRFRLSINTDKEKKYEIYLGPNIAYNIAKGTISEQANAEYWSSGGYAGITVYLPKEFEINTNIDAEYRQKDSRFPTNNNFTIWDAEIRKWLLKKKLQVKLSAKDILNQQNGYNRNFGSSSFTETYNQVLQRHFLVGVVWNFNNSNTGNGGNQ